MPLWLWVIQAVALVALIAALTVIWVVGRRLWLGRGTGAFDLSVKYTSGTGVSGWILGIAVYRGSTLNWYRTFSLSLRPRHRFARNDLVVGPRREPVSGETHALQHGAVVVGAQHRSGVAQLGLTPRALTGLLAWLEASPPGHSVKNVL